MRLKQGKGEERLRGPLRTLQKPGGSNKENNAGKKHEYLWPPVPPWGPKRDRQHGMYFTRKGRTTPQGGPESGKGLQRIAGSLGSLTGGKGKGEASLDEQQGG